MGDIGGNQQEEPDANETVPHRISMAAAAHEVPLATILTVVGVVIAAGLGLALLWALRQILLYVLVAVFNAVLLAPAVTVLSLSAL